jgi:hypothetical protein
MIRLALVLALLAPQDSVKPRYAAEKGARDKVYAETKLGVKIEGSDQLAGFVRSMHPFLSMEKLLIRAEGGMQVTTKNRRKVDYDEARVELRYDDEDHEYDYQKGQSPEGDKVKLRQMMWFFAAGGKNYSLSPEGEYRSDDPAQDHTGEAMDLIGLGITRMPDKEAKPGDTYEKTWKGARSEKGKQAKFDFKQKVTVEKVEEKDGKKVATLSSDLTGKLDGGKDPTAEEGWTKCEGKTKAVIEVDTGRILASEGKGAVVAYFRNTAENGSKQELRLTFSVEGKLAVK